MLFANTLGKFLPESWRSGLKFCSKRILRIGIIFFGFRLTLADVAQVGMPAIGLDLIIVCGTLALGILVGKWLKMDRETTLLTSAVVPSVAQQPCWEQKPRSEPRHTKLQ